MGLFKKSITNFNIVVDGGVENYVPGSIVRGTVHLTTVEPIEYRSIHIAFAGQARASCGHHKDERYTNKDVLFKYVTFFKRASYPEDVAQLVISNIEEEESSPAGTQFNFANEDSPEDDSIDPSQYDEETREQAKEIAYWKQQHRAQLEAERKKEREATKQQQQPLPQPAPKKSTKEPSEMLPAGTYAFPFTFILPQYMLPSIAASIAMRTRSIHITYSLTAEVIQVGRFFNTTSTSTNIGVRSIIPKSQFLSSHEIVDNSVLPLSGVFGMNKGAIETVMKVTPSIVLLSRRDPIYVSISIDNYGGQKGIPKTGVEARLETKFKMTLRGTGMMDRCVTSTTCKLVGNAISAGGKGDFSGAVLVDTKRCGIPTFSTTSSSAEWYVVVKIDGCGREHKVPITVVYDVDQQDAVKWQDFNKPVPTFHGEQWYEVPSTTVTGTVVSK